MSRSFPGVGLVLLAAVVAVAADPPQAPPPRRIPIENLVRQLGSTDPAEREAAAARLGGLALDPPPELIAATKAGDPGVRERAAAVAQAMRWNVAATRLPRGRQFAEKGRVDLFVAATAAWDLKPDDPRLWLPAADLGRRLIDRADMKGDRRPHDCPSAFRDFATYVSFCKPQFTRLDVTYLRPDPREANPPVLFYNEAIQAPGVFSPEGIINNLIVSRGSVQTEKSIQSSVVLANGDVTARNGLFSLVIVCDGDVNLTDSYIHTALIVARGNITAKRGAGRSVLMAGGKVTLEEKRKTTGNNYNVIVENGPNTLGVVFFELSTVGVEVKADGKEVRVTAVADGGAFAKAGAKVGDVVAEVGGKKPDSVEALRRLLRDALAVGDAKVSLVRDGKPVAATVALPE